MQTARANDRKQKLAVSQNDQQCDKKIHICHLQVGERISKFADKIQTLPHYKPCPKDT